jgi:hypothetical protein
MNKKRSIVKYLTAILISILFLTNGYTQLYSTKNKKSDYVSSKTTFVQEYDDIEIKIRMFLHEEYHPGSCYGMPSQVDERIIKSTLKNDPQLVEIIKEKYQVYSDYGIYKILRSMKKFSLEKINEGFKFLFTDGNCCKITRYGGILYMNNDVIIRSEIISKEVTKRPC